MIDSTTLSILLLFGAFSFGAFVMLQLATHSVALYRTHFTESADDNLSKLFVFVDARKVFLTNVAAIVLIPATVYLATRNPVFSIVIAVLGFVAPPFVYRTLAQRRVVAIELALPDALAQLAGAMRAGSTLSIAMEAMVRETKGPISQEFGLVLKEQRVGVAIEEAFENLARRVRSENIDLVVAAALVAKDVGGNLAEIFERLSDTLRQKIAMEGKIKALTAQGKLQGWVVGLLPVGMLLVLSYMESNAITNMLSSLAGWIWLGTMLLLEVLGMLMIRKIVTIDI